MIRRHVRAFSFDDRTNEELTEICEMVGNKNQSRLVREAIHHYHATEARRIEGERALAGIHQLAERVRGAA